MTDFTAFQDFVQLALACVADPAIALRRATVFFKRPSGDSPELDKLREALAADARCEVREYADHQELGHQIREMLDGWFALVAPQSVAPQSTSPKSIAPQ